MYILRSDISESNALLLFIRPEGRNLPSKGTLKIPAECNIAFVTMQYCNLTTIQGTKLLRTQTYLRSTRASESQPHENTLWRRSSDVGQALSLTGNAILLQEQRRSSTPWKVRPEGRQQRRRRLTLDLLGAYSQYTGSYQITSMCSHCVLSAYRYFTECVYSGFVIKYRKEIATNFIVMGFLLLIYILFVHLPGMPQ